MALISVISYDRIILTVVILTIVREPVSGGGMLCMKIRKQG